MSWLIVPFAVRLNGKINVSLSERLRNKEVSNNVSPKSVKYQRQIHFGSQTIQLFEKVSLTHHFTFGSSRKYSNESRKRILNNHTNSYSKDNDNGQFDWPSGSFGHGEDVRRKAFPPTKYKPTKASFARRASPVAEPPSAATMEHSRTRAGTPWLPPMHPKPSWLSRARAAPPSPSRRLIGTPDSPWLSPAHAKPSWLSPANQPTPEQRKRRPSSPWLRPARTWLSLVNATLIWSSPPFLAAFLTSKERALSPGSQQQHRSSCEHPVAKTPSPERPQQRDSPPSHSPPARIVSPWPPKANESPFCSSPTLLASLPFSGGRAVTMIPRSLRLVSRNLWTLAASQHDETHSPQDADDLMSDNFWKARNSTKVKRNDTESKQVQMKLLSSKSTVVRESTALEEPLGFTFHLFDKNGPNSNESNESKSNLKNNSENGLSFLATRDLRLAGSCILRAVGAGSYPGRPPGRPPGHFPGRLQHNYASKNKEFYLIRRNDSERPNLDNNFADPQLPEPNLIITTSCRPPYSDANQIFIKNTLRKQQSNLWKAQTKGKTQ